MALDQDSSHQSIGIPTDNNLEKCIAIARTPSITATLTLLGFMLASNDV